MKIYQIDIKVAATAYIVAETEEQAEAIFEERFSKWNDDILDEGGIVSGARFEDMIEEAKEEGPFATISPPITYHGHWGTTDAPPELELAYEEGDSE